MFFNDGDVSEPQIFRKFHYGITSVLAPNGDINFAIKLKTHKGQSQDQKVQTTTYMLSMVQYLYEDGDFLSAMEMFNIVYSSIIYKNTLEEEDLIALVEYFGNLKRIICKSTYDTSSNTLAFSTYQLDKMLTFIPFVAELNFVKEDTYELIAKVPTGKLGGNVCYATHTFAIRGNKEDINLHCTQFLRLLTLILGDSRLLIGRDF